MKYLAKILVDIFLYDIVFLLCIIGALVWMIYNAITNYIEECKAYDMTVASIEKTFPYNMHQSRDELLLYKRLDAKLGAGTYVLHTCNTTYHNSLRYVFHSTNVTEVSNCELCDYEYSIERH